MKWNGSSEATAAVATKPANSHNIFSAQYKGTQSREGLYMHRIGRVYIMRDVLLLFAFSVRHGKQIQIKCDYDAHKSILIKIVSPILQRLLKTELYHINSIVQSNSCVS